MSTIVTTFSRRHVYGYLAVILALITTAFMGFGLWVHHMFATGLPQMGESFFTAASLMIAIPSGIQIFCWLGTLWGGRIELKTPLLYVIGFIVIFVLGGMTGVMLAAVPLDLQVHDSFFVVAHLHYVLIGGAVFPLLGGVHYWFPKMTGRMLREGLGKVSFWLLFFGFNIVFFPMHILGLDGMPRRVYTYAADRGWGDLNLVATIGVVVLGAGLLVYLVNVVSALRGGAPAPPNPWGGATLEWATSSPPPVYAFLHLPIVRGREALWDSGEELPVVTGMRCDRREVLITNPLDAEPDHRVDLPGPSIWPFLVALATGVAFVGGIFTPWAGPVGLVVVLATLAGWFWPRGEQPLDPQEQRREEAA